MDQQNQDLRTAIADAFTASLIKFSVISVLVLMCLWAFTPFLPIMLWALVLAIALFPAYIPLKARMGGASGRSATLLVLVGMLVIGIPTVLMGTAFASQLFEFAQNLENDRIQVPPPAESVAGWPLVGDILYKNWADASEDLPEFLKRLEPQLAAIGKWAGGMAAGTAGGIFKLLGALIIAGVMLAWADSGSRALDRVFMRFAGEERGLEIKDLTTKTIRSVAIGVIGTAFIAAFVNGFVFTIAGVPGAGVLAVIALLFGIIQLPITLVALVGVGLLWMGDSSSVHNIIFTVLMLVASLADNFIKPLLLGRGVNVPMPVVLIGAIGGMMSGGFLGMFVGAAFLSAGYQIFMEWVDTGDASPIPVDSSEA